MARHTTNPSPYSSMTTSSLANASNPGFMSLSSLIPWSHQQLSSPLFGLGALRPNPFTSLPSGQLVSSAFQPIQPKLSVPRASDFSGVHGFPSYTAPSNMFSFGFNGSAELNCPQNDLNLNINNSFSGLMINAEASAYNILNSTPAPQLSATALLQKALLSGSNSNNVALMKSMESSLSDGMKFNNYGGALGDGTSGGGSTFGEMCNNMNVGGGNTGGYRGGMEYLSDQMNAPYGGMMYNVKNAYGMVVGEVNNNFVVEPQMNVRSEYCDNLTRDFLGIGNGMNSLNGGGMVDDHNGNGIGTNSSDSEATISADVRPFVPGRPPGF